MSSIRRQIRNLPLPVSWLHPSHARKAIYRAVALADSSSPVAVAAAAYLDGEAAVVLMADSWGGKSTLAAHAPLCGYRLVHDGLLWLHRDGQISGDGGPVCLRSGGWQVFSGNLESLDNHLPGITLYPFRGGKLVHFEPRLRSLAPVPVQAVILLVRQERETDPEFMYLTRAAMLAHVLRILKTRNGRGSDRVLLDRVLRMINGARLLGVLSYRQPMDALRELHERLVAPDAPREAEGQSG